MKWLDEIPKLPAVDPPSPTEWKDAPIEVPADPAHLDFWRMARCLTGCGPGDRAHAEPMHRVPEIKPAP